jgi:hypothetical protein
MNFVYVNVYNFCREYIARNVASSNFLYNIYFTIDSEVGNNDYSVIRELLKEIAETSQLDSSKQRTFKGLSKWKINVIALRVIIKIIIVIMMIILTVIMIVINHRLLNVLQCSCCHHGGRQAVQGCPACIAPYHGEVHEQLPVYIVL